jgi:hypothetical protein
MAEQPGTGVRDVTILDSEASHFWFGHWNDVLICVWNKQATGPAVLRLAKVAESMSRQNKKGISTVHLIANHAAIPTAEARTGFIHIMKEYADQLACVGILVSGAGFWASAMTSFLTGIRLVSPFSFDFRIFNNVEQMSVWLPKAHRLKTSNSIESAQLVAVLTHAYDTLIENHH